MLERLAALCSRSEQCESDLQKKMYAAGLTADEIQKILRYLKDNRFLDNSRFARAFANDKVRFSAWGRRKIRAALAVKHISAADISNALESIDHEEYTDALNRCAKAKSRTLNLHQREDVQKLYRHLISRGFESELSVKCIRDIRNSN